MNKVSKHTIWHHDHCVPSAVTGDIYNLQECSIDILKMSDRTETSIVLGC